MGRMHAIAHTDGTTEMVPFSAEEELEFDNAAAAWADGVVDREWVKLRKERNRLLAESDWRAMSDLEMSDAWKVYRQALRDLPANTADPASPTWPEKPA